jgi:hypothetical protein
MSLRRLLAAIAVIALAAVAIAALGIAQNHEIDRTVTATGVVRDASGRLSIRAERFTIDRSPATEGTSG